MEGYVMESKRLTPTIVGKIASKHFVVVVVLHLFRNFSLTLLPYY